VAVDQGFVGPQRARQQALEGPHGELDDDVGLRALGRARACRQREPCAGPLEVDDRNLDSSVDQSETANETRVGEQEDAPARLELRQPPSRSAPVVEEALHRGFVERENDVDAAIHGVVAHGVEARAVGGEKEPLAVEEDQDPCAAGIGRNEAGVVLGEDVVEERAGGGARRDGPREHGAVVVELEVEVGRNRRRWLTRRRLASKKPSMTRAINFNAGPAALPLPALERAQRELLDFAGSGMSVMEHSHRGKEYEAVHSEAIRLLRELYGVPDSYDVLFLQGGASLQFAMVPMNFLAPGKSADYVVTGAWGEKALAEAKTTAALIGARVRVAADTGTGEGKDKAYVRVPVASEIKTDPQAAYVHLTSNETIHGVEFAAAPGASFPDTGPAPLVCDMSSDFGWRPVEVSRFALIYAGAQKNVGPSGIAVVFARKDFVASGRKDVPKILQYRTFADNNSLYNTPPTFSIYLVRNVLAWTKEQGGLPALEKNNREKARVVYAAIDEHAGFYRCPVERESRSVMNVVFRLPSEALEEKFVADAKKLRMIGLKGHRSVGGIRASLYNAVTVEWAKALADFMKDFAKANG
jgi:phosphoserine aminotransferase